MSLGWSVAVDLFIAMIYLQLPASNRVQPLRPLKFGDGSNRFVFSHMRFSLFSPGMEMLKFFKHGFCRLD